MELTVADVSKLPNDIPVHNGHWIDNLFCRQCNRSLTKVECFNMGFNWAKSEISSLKISPENELKPLDEKEVRKVLEGIYSDTLTPANLEEIPKRICFHFGTSAVGTGKQVDVTTLVDETLKKLGLRHSELSIMERDKLWAMAEVMSKLSPSLGTKDEVCNCKEWEENIGKIDAPIQLQAIRSGGKGYDGVQFKYCPWCGKLKPPR